MCVYVYVQPARLMLGFVGAAAFLSMWISNTGTSVLMVPMAVGVLETLRSAQTESGDGTREEEGVQNGDGEELLEQDDDGEGGDGVVVLSESDDDSSEAEMGLLTGVSRSEAEAMELEEVGAMSMELSPSAAETMNKEPGEGMGGVPRRRKGGGVGAARVRHTGVVKPSAKKAMSPIDKYSIGLVLAIAYACSIGGLATLTGTGPNIVLNGYWSRCHADQELNFSNWLLLGVPLAFSLTFLLWAVMAFLYARDMSSHKLNTQSLEEEMRALEPLSWPEKVIVADFVMTVLLWLTRRTEIGGWSDLFPPATAPKDGTVSALSAIVLFMVPTYDGKGGRVLDWNTAKGLPWDIVLILGAGFSMRCGRRSALRCSDRTHLHIISCVHCMVVRPFL